MQDLTKKSFEVLTGPSGRAIAQPMDKGLLEAIYEHITMERNASAQYFSIKSGSQKGNLEDFQNFSRRNLLLNKNMPILLRNI
tara:strand:- start:138 stop:386 length:249 start_codon:yes stop_codon:yes gene_type:complete